MFISAADPESTPVGGAELQQVVWLSVAATVVTIVLLVVAWAHRTHRIEWFDRLGRRLGARHDEPGWSTIPTMFVASSLIVALLGFMWDVSLHAGRGRDAGPLANPAHYLILYGLFALFVAGMAAIVYPRDGEKPGVAAVRITRHWYAPVSGIFIAACGLYALIGFPLDDVWHRLFGQDVTLWGPTHLMLIGGAGLSTAGIILLNREAEIAMRLRGKAVPTWLRTIMTSTAFGALLIGLSVFQAEFDFGIAQFRMVFAPMMIVAAAGLTLVAARLYIGPGAAIGAAIFFLLMRGIISFIVTDVMGEAHHVFPLYLGSAVLVELLAISRLRNRPLAFGAVAGLLIGTVGLAIEKFWNDRVFQFPWSQDMWVEGLVMAVPVAIAAGLCGSLFAMGLQGRLPAKNVGRVIVTASVVVLAAGVANGLHATVPKDATASFELTQVGTTEEPAVSAQVTLSDGVVDDDPTWVQITAWQGGGAGVVTDRLRRTGENTFESTKPVPVGGNWKTLLRVQDGRTLAAVPIFLPADAPLKAKEVPAEASFTRDFVPEIDILQRERTDEHPAWIWAAANMVVLLCSLGIILGICVSVSRVARSIEEHEAADGAERAPTLTS
ncbi:hypothetical protein [Aeromicrobium wangtongii]|uniref:Uncharacterized protein n=1 Tax=Aeromicrobium wangtongii TaxID=2969247 RepID=A0ABY5M7X1_9ACTN|nr:hypothetical protein [Aeromicrobium wangtongii]MCD9196748.1 hypothetical protein [Aeromicrobium wangtongii]UUP14258.1 hypothetical protein NQV15_02785 [Aeromicrobium wangtongii]